MNTNLTPIEEVKKGLEEQKQVEQLEKVKKRRKELLNANVKAHEKRPSPNFYKTLDSTIKKNSAFVKKLKGFKELNKEQKEGLVEGLKLLNFRRYISEAINVFCDLNSFQMDDVEIIIELICILHQYYEEFTQQFLNKLLNSIPNSSNSISESEMNNKKFLLIRILSDLIALGIYPSATNSLYELLENLIKKEKKVNIILSGILIFVKFNGNDFLNFENNQSIKEERFTKLIETFFQNLCKLLKKTQDESKLWTKLYNNTIILGDLINKKVPEFEIIEKEKPMELPEIFQSKNIKLFYTEKEEFDQLEENKLKYKNEEELMNKLPTCVNRHLIKEWCEHFIYLKCSKKKLIYQLFNVSKRSLDLLPLYSRLVYILNIKEIQKELIKELFEEFELFYLNSNLNNNYFNQNLSNNNLLQNYPKNLNLNQILEIRIKNIRFLSELTKFKLIKINLIQNLFKKCLDDFNQNNIYVACHLLETCGRFLNYYSIENHNEFKLLLDTMMRYKNIKSFDIKYNILIESAYYSCQEFDTNKIENENINYKYLYYSFIIHDELNKQNFNKVLKKIRKFNWKDDLFLISDIIRDYTKCKYSNISLLSQLIGSISMLHEFLLIFIIDSIFEDLRLFLLQEIDFSFQKILFNIKLLSELYISKNIDSKIIFDCLYIILNFSIQNDLPQDTFRITLILEVLDTCYPIFKNSIHLNSKLDLFLIHFQHYILSKQIRLPVTIEMNLADILEKIKPNLVWPKNFNASLKIIQQLNSSFFISENSIPSFGENNNLIWEIKKLNVQSKEKKENVNLDEFSKLNLMSSSSSSSNSSKKIKNEDIQKLNKQKLENEQFDRELQQLMEEYSNERKKEITRMKNDNPKIFILKK
eukprot:gene7767-12237_t